jgi:hypothetical protein
MRLHVHEHEPRCDDKKLLRRYDPEKQAAGSRRAAAIIRVAMLCMPAQLLGIRGWRFEN